MANPKTKNILISMMIAMSSAFLIGSILLLSRDTYAVGNSDGKSYQYTGYADTREVVSEAVFVESGNLYKEVGKMTVSGENTMNVSKDIVSKPNHKILSGSLDIKTILSGSQVIVGTGVSSSYNNIFVFSNTSNFKPEIKNTFYINATDGLGISGPSVKSGVNVHGIVKVGLTGTCEASNLGAIGMAQNGCLVGCKKSSSSHKWHLIDKSDRCQEWCQKNSSSCETTSTADTTRELRGGVCTGDVATNSDYYDYKPCDGAIDRAKSLTGVSFISYFTPACPETNENGMVNPCAYTCKNLDDDRCKAGSPNGGGDNTPSCTGVEPNGNGVIKSNKTPSSNKNWSGVDNKTQDQLNACEWTCSGGYEVYGNGCKKISNDCDESYEYGCKNGISPTEKKLENGTYTWMCAVSNCMMCDEDNGFTLHNGYCAKQEAVACCSSLPEHATPLDGIPADDEGVGNLCIGMSLYNGGNGNGHNETCEFGSSFNAIKVGNNFEPVCNPCGPYYNCIIHDVPEGLSSMNCTYAGEAHCSQEQEQASSDLIYQFKCNEGYYLDGCECKLKDVINGNDDHSNPNYGYLSCGWEPNTCKEGYIGLGVSKNGSNLNWMCSNGLGTEYGCFLSCEEPQYWQEHSNIWFCSNPSTETLSCCPEGFKKQQDGTCKISSANMFKVKTETGYIVKETVYLYRHNGAFEDQNGKKYQIEWQYDGNDSNTEMFYGSEYIDSDKKESIMYYIRKVSDYYKKDCVTFEPKGDYSEIKLCNNNNFSVPSNINYCQCDSIENKCYGGDGSYDGSHYTKGYDGSHYTKGYYGSTWICGNVNNRCYRCDNTKGFYKDTNGKCQHVCGTDTLNWKPGKELNSDSNLCSSVGVYVNETLSGSKGTGYSWECKGGSRRKNVYECRTY